MASDIKKEEVEPLKKGIEKGITEGKDVKKVRENIIKRCLGKLVKFLLKYFISEKEKSDISKEEKSDIKSDTEWLKGYRKREETKKKREAYEMLISTSLTSFLIAAVMFYVIKQFESFQGMMADFGAGLINTLLIIFQVIFWISIFVSLITLGIAVYKRYIDYKKNKELKAKKEQKKVEEKANAEKKPIEKKEEKPAKVAKETETKQKVAYQPLFGQLKTKPYTRRYILSPELKAKLEKISKSRLEKKI